MNITDFDMPLWSMVKFILKWSFALIVVAIFYSAIATVFWILFTIFLVIVGAAAGG